MSEKVKKELNLLLISMSKLARSPSESYYKYSYTENGNEVADYFCGISQLEAGTKSYIRRLQRDGRVIDKIFIVESDEARKELSGPEQAGIHRFIKEEMNAVEFYKGRICQYILGNSETNSKDKASEELAKEVQGYEKGLNEKEEGIGLIPLSKLYPKPQELFEDVELKDVKDGKTDERAIYPCASELCKKIQQIQNENSDKDVKLFIDMQGARRYETFIINAAVKMLEMRGIKVESSIAINYDFDNNKNGLFNDIVDTTINDRMFDMVSGMQEFINTGRGDTLEKFRKYLDSELEGEKDIIDAIINISNAISICDVKKFDEELKNFSIRYNEYIQKDEEKKNALFETYVDDLKNDYDQYGLLENEPTKLLINQVEWCLSKKLYQQALTLIEAKTPDFMAANEFFYYKDSQHENYNIVDLIKYINGNRGWTKFPPYLLDRNIEQNQDRRIIAQGKEVYTFIKYALGWKPYNSDDISFPNSEHPLEGLTVKTQSLNHCLIDGSCLRTNCSTSQEGVHSDYMQLANLLVEYKKMCDLRNNVNHSYSLNDNEETVETMDPTDIIEKRITDFLNLLSNNQSKINLYDQFKPISPP